METNLLQKIRRLNDLYSKYETMKALTDAEYNEQGMLREEILNYFKYAIDKHSKNMV